MVISAEITGIKYTPFLCSELKSYKFNKIKEALSNETSFILEIDENNKLAISWWVSAKRTRSYPYARVYNTLNFSGKKVTIIPVFKDEGKEGDRDFLQWDTISLMSLLGINVIIAYYVTAEKSSRYNHKITKQKFNTEYIKKEIKRLLHYQSDPLHWNLEQTNRIGLLGHKAIKAYIRISKKLMVDMHSLEKAKLKIDKISKSRNEFIRLSRGLAEQAQLRESVTEQPKEFLVGAGEKAVLTIENYLGGNYFFTVDESSISGKHISLVEAKHTSKKNFPSQDDIKDGLLKMVLFTNLKKVKVNDIEYLPQAVLQLTSNKGFYLENLNDSQSKIFTLLMKEAKTNNFSVELL